MTLERVRRDGQVIDVVTLGVPFGVNLRQQRAEAGVRGGVVEVAAHVIEAREQGFQDRRIEGADVEGPHRVGHHCAKVVVYPRPARHADDGQAPTDQAVLDEVDNRREEQPLREVPGGAEDDQHTRRRESPVWLNHACLQRRAMLHIQPHRATPVPLRSGGP